MPIVVDVLFVGLDGSGHLGVQLPDEDVREWMEHLDHIIPHSVLRTTDVSSEQRERHSQADDLLESAGDLGAPSSPRIQYRYRTRFVRLSSKVTDVIERHLSVHHRVDLSEPSGDAFQVDPEGLTQLLESLAEYIGLTDSYHLFVLNPSLRWLPTAPSNATGRSTTYGYRSGFSVEEMDSIRASTKLADLDARIDQQVQRAAAAAEKKTTTTPQTSPDDPTTTDSSLTVLDRATASGEWATRLLATPFRAGPQSVTEFLELQLVHQPLLVRRSLASAPSLRESCLVDQWVGLGRTIFIDLTAGPSSWGPLLAGRGGGVRHTHARPDVRTFVSQWREEQQEAAEDPSGSDSFVDNVIELDAVRAERVILTDLLRTKSCGEKTEEASRSPHAFCRRIAAKLIELDAWEKKNADVVEVRSASAGATGSKVVPPSLDTLDGLSFFHDDSTTSSGGRDPSLEVDHFLAHLSATLIGALHQAVTPPLADVERENGAFVDQVHFRLYVLAQHQRFDPLQARLFARLKNGLDQLRLSGQTFTYTVHQLRMDDDPQLSMAFTQSLRTDVVPVVRFDGRLEHTHRRFIDSSVVRAQLSEIDLASKAARDRAFGKENRAAAAAAAASTATPTTAATPAPPGSATGINVDTAAAGLAQSTSRDISIFLFSVDHPLPTFVDRHFQSRPRVEANIIVAAQSNVDTWDGPLTCNSRPTFLDLRDPVPSILASAAHLLGGLLPLHASRPSFSDVATPAEDWSWSVGATPLAFTSAHGEAFAQVQKDALHRGQLLAACRRAAHTLNAQVRRLAREKTTERNRPVVEQVPTPQEDVDSSSSSASGTTSDVASRLDTSFARVRSTLARALLVSRAHLDANVTGTTIGQLQRQLRLDTSQLVDDVDGALGVVTAEPHKTSRRTRPEGHDRHKTERVDVSRHSDLSSPPQRLSSHWYLLTVVVCAAIGLRRLLARRTDKPKIN